MICTRKLRRLGEVEAQDAFANKDWLALVSVHGTVDTALDDFYQALFAIVDTFAPITSIKVNSLKHAPWTTPPINTAQREVRALYRRYQCSKRQRDLLNYRRARDILRDKQAAERTAYYRTRF